MSGGSYWIPLNTVFVFFMLLMYIILGGYMEHKHVKFGHETGVALTIGLIISASVHYIAGVEHDIPFSGTVFFYVCLPPIIFAAGFNMRRRRFFANIGYILFFGVVGTIFTFFVFAALNVAVMKIGFLKMYSYDPVT
jgi:NhaP-type Na+/H+ or K+/H+ antiporter